MRARDAKPDATFGESTRALGASLVALSPLLAATVGCSDLIGLSDLDFDRAAPDAGGGGTAGGDGIAGFGGGGAGGVGGSGCESALFIDGFDDGRFEADWDPLVTMPGSIEETGGELVFSVESGGTVSLSSDNRFELVGGVATLELVQAGGLSSRTAIQFLAEEMRLSIEKNQDSLILDKQVSLVTTGLWQGAYEPAAHRFLRIRDEAEDLHFEASADGVEFTSLAVVPHADIAPLADVGIELELNANGGDAEARFDDLALCP